MNRKTAAAISYVQETVSNPADLFWASAPDAFEVLKAGGFLNYYRPLSRDIPKKIGGYPVHDPEGYYTGFAISGYGIMWNYRYLITHGLNPPKTWQDLTSHKYYSHIGMCTPVRSGTTHIAVESILQSQGWDTGWATLLEIAGNLATVTARSFGVPDGVKNGRFGIGIVIDFFGLSSKLAGFPVSFTYPPGTALLPANIALIKGAQNPEQGKKFIDFLISAEGQQILFDPEIARLPVMPKIYSKAPKGYPNPFQNKDNDTIYFNCNLSQQRYHLVNTMFDCLITYRSKALNKTWQAIHRAKLKAQKNNNPESMALVQKAKELALRLPVSSQQACDQEFTSIFQRHRPGKSLPLKQVQLEKSWDDFSRSNLKKARDLAIQAMVNMEKIKKP